MDCLVLPPFFKCKQNSIFMNHIHDWMNEPKKWILQIFKWFKQEFLRNDWLWALSKFCWVVLPYPRTHTHDPPDLRPGIQIKSLMIQQQVRWKKDLSSFSSCYSLGALIIYIYTQVICSFIHSQIPPEIQLPWWLNHSWRKMMTATMKVFLFLNSIWFRSSSRSFIYIYFFLDFQIHVSFPILVSVVVISFNWFRFVVGFAM